MDVEHMNPSDVFLAIQYDMVTNRLFALVQRPLIFGQGPIGSMLAVYSTKYNPMRFNVWDEEFIVEGLDITSLIVHSSFTFSDFNNTITKPDRFLNLMYEDNTVVTIDMYTRTPVVNGRPFLKLEALGLMARHTPR
jgi:hypothetical protein